ncbi:hypothetical protein [Rhodoligotrophos appendicifer]|uniref:hypothetical protein n=1 Tax=Rhodoligotrophos appendicifer TaxID=987056 RepID=UPI003D1D5FCA
MAEVLACLSKNSPVASSNGDVESCRSGKIASDVYYMVSRVNMTIVEIPLRIKRLRHHLFGKSLKAEG